MTEKKFCIESVRTSGQTAVRAAVDLRQLESGSSSGRSLTSVASAEFPQNLCEIIRISVSSNVGQRISFISSRTHMYKFPAIALAGLCESCWKQSIGLFQSEEITRTDVDFPCNGNLLALYYHQTTIHYFSKITMNNEVRPPGIEAFVCQSEIGVNKQPVFMY